jgi:hypothetical protein
MKLLFGKPTSDVVYLDPDEGVFFTSQGGASIEYRFEDNNLVLEICEMWFAKADIDELIEFLKAAKEQLK